MSYAFAEPCFFSSLASSLSENMSELDWEEGEWVSYGKDLETALQSEEAQACTV